MSQQVRVDPVRGHEAFHAWGSLVDATGPVGMVGHDMLDAAAFSLLKAEFMAAQAGVVPFVPLPGGGQGVLTVGGAIGKPESAWPQAELRHLYMLNHRGMASIHASVEAKRPKTPDLVIVPAAAPTEIDAAPFVVPVAAWVVLGAVGILATIAGTYYATRTEETKIQVDAGLAGQQFKTSALADLAQKELALRGSLSPELIKAIAGVKGGGSSSYFWPGVAIGAGTAVAAGAGAFAYSRKRKRR